MSKPNTFLAISALSLTGDAVPAWIPLLPVTNGAVSAVDGRKFTIRDAASIVRATLARGPIAIDINHSTDTAAKIGMPSPAVGWIEEIALHGPANEPGIWGRVDWTPAGETAMREKQYRFVSPVLVSAKSDGSVLQILRASLTNDPALTMTGLFHSQEETNVDLTELCTLLGLPPNSTADQVRSKLNALTANNAAMCAREKLMLSAAGLTGDALDDTTTTAICTKLKVPAAAANTDVAQLTAKVEKLTSDLNSALLSNSSRDVTGLVEEAIKAGKIAPAMKDQYLDLFAANPEKLKTFIAAQPVIIQDGKIIGAAPAEGDLSPTEKATCTALGITEEAFKATKAADAKRAK